MHAALITGASAGLGKEFARIHASKGGNLYIVARRKALLDEIAGEIQEKYKVKVKIIVKDITEPDAAETIIQEVKSQGDFIDYLINNAGFGGGGSFLERSDGEDLKMVDLNIKALIDITKKFLPEMVNAGKGKVLNVSSTAGFLPGPFQATYYASKAFVNSFTQAIAEELRGTGVTATALCPGYTETEFAKNAGLETLKAFKKGANPYKVALHGYRAMLKGKDITISEPGLKFMLKYVAFFIPRKLIIKMSRYMMTKEN